MMFNMSHGKIGEPFLLKLIRPIFWITYAIIQPPLPNSDFNDSFTVVSYDNGTYYGYSCSMKIAPEDP